MHQKKVNIPMVLNKDILDTIRNRRYTLKPVAVCMKPPANNPSRKPLSLTRGRRMYHSMKHFPNTYDFKLSNDESNEFSNRGCIIANILKRRVSMEYVNDSDDAEDDTFSFS